jgi:acyl-CoA dehydrogenase
MFEPTARTRDLRERLVAFCDAHIYPNESLFHEQIDRERWQVAPIVEALKVKARAAGLWNLFLPHSRGPHDADSASWGGSDRGAGLTNLEYAPLCEVMGRSPGFGPEVFNCSAPDTGNMEVLARYGTPAQQDRWLTPLLDGRIRSCFAMTEPDVASSDATNIRSTITRDGGDYVINGHKWWISGAGDPRCAIAIFMGQSNPGAAPHQRQSMILVPMDTRGITIKRMMRVFGYDDAPHGHAEITFENVRVPAENILLGEGRGFEIAQGRLGPGRIHHCMRLIGVAERALETMRARVSARVAFGKTLAEQGAIRRDLAGAPADIASGASDGYGGQQGRARRDRDDQGGGPECGARRARSRHPGARRQGRKPGHLPRARVGVGPGAAARRRARRGPSRGHCQARTAGFWPWRSGCCRNKIVIIFLAQWPGQWLSRAHHPAPRRKPPSSPKR